MSVNLMTLIIYLLCFLSLILIILYFIKHQTVRKIEERYQALANENRALLQQLTIIRGDKAYEGIHLKEVQHAFEELDQTIRKLRIVCKVKPSDTDVKLKKWQGVPPDDEFSQDLHASQIKISFNTQIGAGDKENPSPKEQED